MSVDLWTCPVLPLRQFILQFDLFFKAGWVLMANIVMKNTGKDWLRPRIWLAFFHKMSSLWDSSTLSYCLLLTYEALFIHRQWLCISHWSAQVGLHSKLQNYMSFIKDVNINKMRRHHLQCMGRTAALDMAVLVKGVLPSSKRI